jgi:hypothetical protein
MNIRAVKLRLIYYPNWRNFGLKLKSLRISPRIVTIDFALYWSHIYTVRYIRHTGRGDGGELNQREG